MREPGQKSIPKKIGLSLSPRVFPSPASESSEAGNTSSWAPTPAFSCQLLRGNGVFTMKNLKDMKKRNPLHALHGETGIDLMRE
jgi:hypothetical protein